TNVPTATPAPVVSSASSQSPSHAPQNEQVSNAERGALHALLRGIHHLCECFGIPYMVAQGTLLGAMRHHSLVPWTGDAEVAVDYSYIPYLFVLSLLQTS
ncbi:unnamed protein product, partial [Amoebophrya sp. A25]